MFFSKKYTLQDTGILNGWVDRHSHILPGVDDGIQTMNDSLNVLSFYEEQGISEVWLTPHIMEDCPNTPEELRERYAELKAEYKGDITLHLAAENMVDSLFVKRLEQNNLLPYGDNADEILIETSYVQAPYRFKNMLQDIKKAGYHPVLAHPERYHYMDYEDYDMLHEQGIRFQLNLVSLVGGYGPEAKERAEYLLEENYYKYEGSDLHSLSYFKKAIAEKKLKKQVYSTLVCRGEQ